MSAGLGGIPLLLDVDVRLDRRLLTLMREPHVGGEGLAALELREVYISLRAESRLYTHDIHSS